MVSIPSIWLISALFCVLNRKVKSCIELCQVSQMKVRLSSNAIYSALNCVYPSPIYMDSLLIIMSFSTIFHAAMEYLTIFLPWILTLISLLMAPLLLEKSILLRTELFGSLGFLRPHGVTLEVLECVVVP